MKTTIELLQANAQVSGYKINIHKKESCELFFVKGKLEKCTQSYGRPARSSGCSYRGLR